MGRHALRSVPFEPLLNCPTFIHAGLNADDEFEWVLAAHAIGVSPRSLLTWNAAGRLPEYQADRACTALGLWEGELWPELYEEAIQKDLAEREVGKFLDRHAA